MDAAASHLLDFSKPFDTALLDQLVAIAYDGSNSNRKAAEDFLIRMRENPDMWKRAADILDSSKQLNSIFFALQVLAEAISSRWKILPLDHREGVKNYIVGKIMTLSSTEASLKAHKTYLDRLNLTLIEILKQDWPNNWPTFISDIVGSSKSSESVCENNMKILRLLSEEVFDFSRESMTSIKVKTMKESLNEEFSQVFQLCEYILDASQRQSLLLCTLQTLQRFLTWIPLGYIFETNIVPGLLSKFFPIPIYRTATIDCLTEIASLPPSDIPEVYAPIMQMVLVGFIEQLSLVIPRGTDLNKAFNTGSEDEKLFVQRLALFLSTYLKSFLGLFDNESRAINHEATVVEALLFLIRISKIEQLEDDDIFKTCLEFWVSFTKDLYTSDIEFKRFGELGGSSSVRNPKHIIYENILCDLRIVMIDHMAKPEEVIIVVDENGEIVRENTKDTEVIAQYKTMREAVVYLTHLNYDDTETVMLEKLEYQVTGGGFSWGGLNTLCWAIGSISGAMSEVNENRFLIAVIRSLLVLCEERKGKENKAVVASNIMYIVGQYPRFLRAHWKFLKTVVNKLFEFMHESFPGVQDMACDTFIKIAQKCKRKFMTPQTEDPQPFILTLIHDISKHTQHLQTHQVQSFYESVGTMLSDHGPAIRFLREEVILRLMDVPNTSWREIIMNGSQNIQSLFKVECAVEISRILKINIRVCVASGSIFVHQLKTIFMDILTVYRIYSEQITAAVAREGNIATRYHLCRVMRGVKSDILELMTVLMEACKEIEGGPQSALQVFLPPLMTEVLNDYRTAPPAARDPKVLTLFSTAICILKENISSEVPHIMDAIFEPTLQMITANMLDHPEHRIGFYRFLREANEYCFYGLFSIAPHSQKLVVDSIVWAFKHTERNISETGLELLEKLLLNIEPNLQISQPFYQAYLLSLIQDIISVMSDRTHKSGFKLQATILKHLCHIVQTGTVQVALFDTVERPGIDNSEFLKGHISQLLIEAFPNLTAQQVTLFVLGLFDTNLDINAFKQHLRDFLVEVKEFANEDNSELFAEETAENLEKNLQNQWKYRASVPGLLKPDEYELDELNYENNDDER